jgi:hypothetical protein
MSFIGSIINYIQDSERLIVVTVVLSISGIAIYFGEYYGVFEFTGLPDWVKPSCKLAWVVSTVHVFVKMAMAIPGLMRWLSSLRTRYSTAQAENVLIKCLLEVKGLAREVLCYARHHGRDRIWVSEARREPVWIRELKQFGLVELTDADHRTSYYRIHRVAWKYIKSRPGKFICKMAWEEPPWTVQADDEEHINRRIEGYLGQLQVGAPDRT